MKRIIFFDASLHNFDTDAQYIGNHTCSTVYQVNGWSALVNLLCSDTITCSPHNPNATTVLIFNQLSLEILGTTTNEIVDALTTISMVTGIKISIGVMIHDKCSQILIKSLKNSNINGIVPDYKKFGNADFFDALNSLLLGPVHWPEAYIVPKIKPSTKATKQHSIKLTVRQREIMTLVANRGLSNKKIAQILNISESTVKVHVSAVLKAYGVRNRTQLALAAATGRL